MSQPAQDIEFKSLLNFRDAGDLPLAGMKYLKQGILFRSANPDRLGRGDIEKLRLLNIRTIIDLRGPGEVRKGSVTIDGADRLSLPLDFQGITRKRFRPVIYKKGVDAVISDISNEIYLEILKASGQVFKQVMELLASPGRSPVLIHCQAGKDRTGIIIALILLALGVDRKSIISDFMKSNDALLPYFRRQFLFRKIFSLGIFPYRNMLFAVTVKQRNIESVLDLIENHYGGINGYLRHTGFDTSGLADVRHAMISG